MNVEKELDFKVPGRYRDSLEFHDGSKKAITVFVLFDEADQCKLVCWEGEPGLYCWDLKLAMTGLPDDLPSEVVELVTACKKAGGAGAKQFLCAAGAAPNLVAVTTAIHSEWEHWKEPLRSSLSFHECMTTFTRTLEEMREAAQ